MVIATPEYWVSCCGDFHPGTEISQAALQTAIDIDRSRFVILFAF
jgi:hypothetical protein